MAQGLTGLNNGFGFAAGALLCLVLGSSCAADNTKTNTMPSTNSISPNSASAAAESARLAKQMQTLKELALPDEWYSAEGATLAAHFDAAAKAMRAKDPQAPSGPQLMARFENGGKPFIHSVWFFHPLRCPKCNQGGSNGFQTVMSVRLGLYVRITAGEMHAVTAHGDAFPSDKLALLKKILDPP
jgi:hypothetical protein